MSGAHWIRKTHLFRRDEYVCTRCGYFADKPYRECPGCKSRMWKGKYDPGWVDEMEAMSALMDDDW